MQFAQLLFFFLIIIPSAIIHEYAHGWAADQMGDPTARNAGRLTLNPMAHIDIWGTILMPVLLLLFSHGSFMFAYAKPVPYNPYNLKNQKWGPALVGLAGPAANLMLMVFNLVPIPPLDGSKILFAVLPDSKARLKINLERFGFIILLLFIFYFFGLIVPIITRIFHLITGKFIF